MTTIAYRDGVLAADTIMTSGGVLIGECAKIVRRADGDMAGGAGDATFLAAFRDWFMGGETEPLPELKEGDTWMDRAAVFRRDGWIEVFEPRGKFDVRARYYAMGSGKEAALGAMFAGADAVTAVMAAIEHDPHTGGGVTVLRAGKARGVVLRSRGTKLYAVRDKGGKSRDVVTYKRVPKRK